MEEFNSYPWGHLAFEMLVENFNEVKKVHVDRKINTHIDGPVKKEYIVCSGFTLAIQLWAYEAIPRLAGCSAFLAMAPRMLWWSSSDKPSLKLLNKKVFQPRKKHKPSELERQSESFKSAVEWENTIHSEGSPQMMNIDAMKMNMHGEGSSGNMQQESLREIVKTESSRCLDDKYKQLHQDNEKLVNIINLLINQMGGMQGTGLAGSTGGIDIRKVDSMRRPHGTSNVVQSPQRSHTTATPAVSCTDANHTAIPTGIDAHGYIKTPQTEVKHIDNGVQRGIAIQWNVDGEFYKGCSEFKYFESDLSNSASESTVCHHSVDDVVPAQTAIDNTATGKETSLKTKRSVSQKYRQSKRSRQVESTSSQAEDRVIGCGASQDKFEQWRKVNATTNSTIDICSGYIKKVNARWFSSIYNETSTLTPENMDALMHLVMWKAKSRNIDHVQDWATVDYFFGAQLSDVYRRWCVAKSQRIPWNWSMQENIIMEYVSGVLRLEGMKVPWTNAKKVYGVLNINKRHWAVFELEFEKQSINVYDPCHVPTRHSSVATQFKAMVQMLPSICSECGVWKEKNVADKDVCWTISANKVIPKHKVSSDSGVLCIKFIEHLVLQGEVGDVDPLLCSEYRRQLCCELFNCP